MSIWTTTTIPTWFTWDQCESAFADCQRRRGDVWRVSRGRSVQHVRPTSCQCGECVHRSRIRYPRSRLQYGFRHRIHRAIQAAKAHPKSGEHYVFLEKEYLEFRVLNFRNTFKSNFGLKNQYSMTQKSPDRARHQMIFKSLTAQMCLPLVCTIAIAAFAIDFFGIVQSTWLQRSVILVRD